MAMEKSTILKYVSQGGDDLGSFTDEGITELVLGESVERTSSDKPINGIYRVISRSTRHDERRGKMVRSYELRYEGGTD